MRNRLVLAVLAVAVLASVAPASAAPRRPKPKPKPPLCFLIKDAAGEAGVMGNMAGQTTYDPNLDITSADVGISATTITVVIRVKDLVDNDDKAPTGRTWAMTFSNGTASAGFNAFRSPLGGEQFNTGKGVFDYDRNEIRIHANLSDLPNAKIKKGAVLRAFGVTSNVVVGLDPSYNAGYAFAPVSSPADQTDPQSTASFTVGTVSCVKVGS